MNQERNAVSGMHGTLPISCQPRDQHKKKTMPNLPITSNNPQLPDYTANTLQPNGSADTQALIKPFVTLLSRQIGKGESLDEFRTRSPTLNARAPDNSAGQATKDAQDQAAITTHIPTEPANSLQPNSSSGAQTLIEPFVALLARQIDKNESLDEFRTRSPTLNARAPDNSAGQVAEDAQDQAAITAHIPTEPANTLIAGLLQLPREISETAHRPATPSTNNRNSTRIDITTFNASSRMALSIARPDTTDIVPDEIDVPASLSDQHIIFDQLNQDTVKRVALATLSASLTQSTPIIAQAITSSAMPAIIPNTLPNYRGADVLQTIATPLGKDGWSNEFTQKISWMSSQKNQVAELHLNPPDLGPLDVVLKISDNQATAMFMSPHSAVRDAVENALPRLREILADNGIALGNATVSDQSPRDAERFMRQGSNTAAQRDDSSEASRSENILTATTQIPSVHRHHGMVDTFA